MFPAALSSRPMTRPDEPPRALTADYVHETAVGYLDGRRDARILDVPCGEGALLYELHGRGYTNLFGVDIEVAQCKVRDIATIAYSDIDRRIAHDDGSFDVVFCIECIEHVENQFHLVRELARVAKPGGRVIVSTPNILSTNARSKYLTAGYLPYFKELSTDWEALRSQGFQGHISPIPLHRLLFMAGRHGLAFEQLKTNRHKRRPRLKDRILAAAIRHSSRRHYKDKETLALLTSDEVLFGDILVLAFRKQAK
jgi:2-polyprenyl-3-methyl-5-hydroxy-6-metoxy-1,4-benzoquinol methylase